MATEAFSHNVRVASVSAVGGMLYSPISLHHEVSFSDEQSTEVRFLNNCLILFGNEQLPRVDY
jgi:hypothetical protein